MSCCVQSETLSPHRGRGVRSETEKTTMNDVFCSTTAEPQVLKIVILVFILFCIV